MTNRQKYAVICEECERPTGEFVESSGFNPGYCDTCANLDEPEELPEDYPE